MYAHATRRLWLCTVPILRRAICAMDLATNENRAMVKRYVAALCRSAEAVDDLSQEVFVRAIERTERLHAAEKAPAFLRGIARHVVQEYFRQQQRNRRWREFDEVMLQSLANDKDDAVWQQCDDQQTLATLRKAVTQLPVVSRRMLEMRYHDGMNATQIAAALDIQPTAVRVSLLRIRQRLARQLNR